MAKTKNIPVPNKSPGEWAGNLQRVEISAEMKNSYMDYAMSVIVSRALPDVRDGLKPVQRRILYAMYDQGLKPGTKFTKCAAIVGEVMKKYHPHGDQSIYDTLVRLAQPWVMRYPLIDSQGNFGSMDGDAAAAQRYTEARMALVAAELLKDIDKQTVPFGDNYSAEYLEPLVLPGLFPNLLVNGVTGIAVGMATNIPPHNLGEVVDATIALIRNPLIPTDGLLAFVKGPDFPTAGIIFGPDLINVYNSGRGKITVRGRVELETSPRGRDQLVITEVPYQVNKARLVESIAELVNSKKIEGVADAREESGRENPVRVVIELKKEADWVQVLEALYKNTALQSTYGAIFLGLVDGQPKVLSLKELLTVYIEHRRFVVKARTTFDLNKALGRAHIIDGLLTALSKLDEVIAIIRRSTDEATAIAKLKSGLKLSEEQARAIVDLRLGRLSRLEATKLKEEKKELAAVIKGLQTLLASAANIDENIIEELYQLKVKYGQPRKTEVRFAAPVAVSAKEMGIAEEVGVVIVNEDSLKLVPIEKFAPILSKGTSDGRKKDTITGGIKAAGRGEILIFSDKGEVVAIRTREIVETGVLLSQLSSFPRGTKVAGLVQAGNYSEEEYLILVSRFGQVQRTTMSTFANSKRLPTEGLKLKSGDSLRFVWKSKGEGEILLLSDLGKAVRFKESDLRPTGRGTQGVNGINLYKGGEICYAGEALNRGELLLVTKKGFAKRTKLSEYPVQGRAVQGVAALDITNLVKTGEIAGAKQIADEKGSLTVLLDADERVEITIKEVKRMARASRGQLILEKGKVVKKVLGG